MGCPQCQSDEISASGVCLVCGYKIATGHAEGTLKSSVKEEIPRWRQELSQRLSAIKQTKETTDSFASSKVPDVAPPLDSSQARAVEPQRIAQTHPDDEIHRSRSAQMLSRSPEKTRPPYPQQKPLAPLGSEVFPTKPPSGFSDRQEVKNLIDSAVSRQSVRLEKEAHTFVHAPQSDSEGKLILLSRTLSGLIDLIFIVLCTGAFIISADYFSGIVLLDLASLADYALLFLLTYFLYSLFFLAASSQTIGMMITDLRVVGSDERRPSMAQLFSRCSGYLLSVLGLGFGLLWSLFDRDSLCFHDRLSRTHIVRI